MKICCYKNCVFGFDTGKNLQNLRMGNYAFLKLKKGIK